MAAPAVLDLTTWTARPVTLLGADPLIYERYYAAAAQALDGRVFVVGGMTAHYLGIGTPQASADVLVFDPATETIQAVGQLLTARVLAGILPMEDGSIEVYGGSNWGPRWHYRSKTHECRTDFPYGIGHGYRRPGSRQTLFHIDNAPGWI